MVTRPWVVGVVAILSIVGLSLSVLLVVVTPTSVWPLIRSVVTLPVVSVPSKIPAILKPISVSLIATRSVSPFFNYRRGICRAFQVLLVLFIICREPMSKHLFIIHGYVNQGSHSENIKHLNTIQVHSTTYKDSGCNSYQHPARAREGQ